MTPLRRLVLAPYSSGFIPLLFLSFVFSLVAATFMWPSFFFRLVVPFRSDTGSAT
jgi:hypothetical protein